MSFLHLLENIRTPILTTLLGFVTYFGNQILIIAVISFIYWCVDKKKGCGSAFAFLFSGIILQGMKIAFRIERPWVKDSSLHPVESALADASGYSFPSGHAQASSNFLIFVYDLFKNKLIRVICILLLVLVPFSRMYLGVHTPSDVLVGLVIGIVPTLLCLKYADKLYNNYIVTGVACSICSIALFIYSYILYKNGTVPLEQALDSIKSAAAGLAFGIGFIIERRFINFTVDSKNIFRKIIRYVCGMGLVLLIKVGTKALLGEGVWQSFLNYFFTIFTVCVIYPFIFSLVNKKLLTKC